MDFNSISLNSSKIVSALFFRFPALLTIISLWLSSKLSYSFSVMVSSALFKGKKAKPLLVAFTSNPSSLAILISSLR